MRRALELAAKGRGRTSPNPMVGAVLVKDGRILGEGYHMAAGGFHAEVNAIAQAGDGSRGSTLYINLEPCCHFGKTPPCTAAIGRAGIARVVAAMEDPNPVVSGRGVEGLRSMGIEVEIGLLEREARKLNEAFIKYVTTGMPFVTLKTAVSLDGRVATGTGVSRWISGEESRRLVHRWRSQVDAVMVGVRTVLVDDPLLTARLEGEAARDPKRVVLDSCLCIPLQVRLFRHERPSDTIIATTERGDLSRRRELEERGVTVLVVKESGGLVDVVDLMEKLGQMGIAHVMIEGGSHVNASALKAGVVDKVSFFIAPIIIGGADAPGAVGGVSPETLDEAIRLKDVKVTRVGEDILVEGYVKR